MNDTNDRKGRKLDWDEFERLDDRIYADTRANSDAKDEVARLQKDGRDTHSPLDRVQDRVDRLDKVQEQSAMRHVADFDPQREVELEDFEYRTNPEGTVRRKSNEGLDPASEREVRDAIRRPRKRRDGA